ncbi:MAG: hypothetical protein ACI8S6_003826 [Myxococcota bacterium]|jgi:hypothetical protein
MNEQDFAPELEGLVFHKTLSGWKVTAPVFRLDLWRHESLLLSLVWVVPISLYLCATVAPYALDVLLGHYTDVNARVMVGVTMLSLAITITPVLILLSDFKISFHIEGDDMAVQHRWMGRTLRTRRIPLSAVDTEQLNRNIGSRLHLSDDLKLRISLPPAERALLRTTITESAKGAEAHFLPPEPEALRRLRAAERESL